MKNINRQLTENIPNWVYYPQLGILYHQLGISHSIGNWGLLSHKNKTSEDKIPNNYLDKISPILYPRLGENVPDWGYFLLVV